MRALAGNQENRPEAEFCDSTREWPKGNVLNCEKPLNHPGWHSIMGGGIKWLGKGEKRPTKKDAVIEKLKARIRELETAALPAAKKPTPEDN